MRGLDIFLVIMVGSAVFSLIKLVNHLVPDPSPPLVHRAVSSPAFLVSDSLFKIVLSQKTPWTDDAHPEILVEMKANGTMLFGKNYEPDEAAEKFWEAVQRKAPCKCEK